MKQKNAPRVAILGSVGVPARYGGFETLADNLVRFHANSNRPEDLCVYCSKPAYPDQPETFGNATLRYSRYAANGASSIIYDATTLRDAINRGVDVILLLGVSGAIALPALARRGARIITHVDGLEWRRAKWSAPARAYLRWSERLAVRHSDSVITDSPSIADHLLDAYGTQSEVIAYGGDHAMVAPVPPSPAPSGLPEGYTLALCRIVPENNITMVLEASMVASTPLAIVGNWDDSAYGRELRARFGSQRHLKLLDPIYAPGPLYALRKGAARYVHGHSAGGTNPALVEMMHFGLPIAAFDCTFNRHATHNGAQFFSNKTELAALFSQPLDLDAGHALQSIARAHYMWNDIGAQYFDLFARMAARP
jgi:glycosyltransferase involved in cell wall biosynthesis